MKNLYLIKSGNKDSLDIIVDLNAVFTFRCICHEKKYHICMDYTQSDSVKAEFKDEKSMREELRNILKAMGANVSLADEIKCGGISDAVKERMKEREEIDKSMNRIMQKILS